MKKVLVLYYSQSGHLTSAVKTTLQDLENHSDIQVDYQPLEPVNPFPFPWRYMQFFDAFPETVKGVPCELMPLPAKVTEIPYDLIIIAYTSWFLSPSRPIDSFLQSMTAHHLLKNRNVVTLVACRNMWLNAQERMKQRLQHCGAKLQGHIAYVDRASNLTSLVTVVAFTLSGVKDRFLGLFPKYGVSDEELQTLGRQHGTILMQHLMDDRYETLQQELVNSGAVPVKANLMIMEGRAKILFPFYADFILNKGNASPRGRKIRVRFFAILLPILILILSPVITIISHLTPVLFKTRFGVKKGYYESTVYDPNKT